jgi:hypothetical protein
MKTAWRRLAMVQLTTAHHLIWILKMVWQSKMMFYVTYVFSEMNSTTLRENVNRFRQWRGFKIFSRRSPCWEIPVTPTYLLTHLLHGGGSFLRS